MDPEILKNLRTFLDAFAHDYAPSPTEMARYRTTARELLARLVFHA
jgi:hypothetical protein